MTREEFFRLYDFSSRTIVVTGGSGTLCREIAAMLHAGGASVAILSRDPEKACSVFPAPLQQDDRMLFLQSDVLNKEVLQENAARIIDSFGRIDGLVNGAGGNQPQATTGPERPFFDLSLDSLRDVSDLNLLGTVLPCQVFGRCMAAQGEGVILNISSMSAFRPLTKIPAYSAAKAALSNFTQWLAVHLAQEYSPKIRVNAIAPGFFATKQNWFLLFDAETGEMTPRGRQIIAHTPMRRFGEPADLLGAVLWLLSPASAFVTGTVVPIDGGFSAFSGV